MSANKDTPKWCLNESAKDVTYAEAKVALEKAGFELVRETNHTYRWRHDLLTQSGEAVDWIQFGVPHSKGKKSCLYSSTVRTICKAIDLVTEKEKEIGETESERNTGK
ncbi:MAG: hypothetical protein JSS72_01840 [Armatimonadetes bacterium]|nr:hypothetical protein [Armatimonadota bacterium]